MEGTERSRLEGDKVTSSRVASSRRLRRRAAVRRRLRQRRRHNDCGYGNGEKRALIARYFPSPDSPSLPPSLPTRRRRKEGGKKTCYLCIPRGKPLMTTHVFAPRLKREREGKEEERERGGAAFSCPLLPRGAITDTSALLSLSLSLLFSSPHFIPERPLLFFFLREQSRFVRYLALSGVCLVSWSVRLMFGASPPLLSSLPALRPSFRPSARPW